MYMDDRTKGEHQHRKIKHATQPSMNVFLTCLHIPRGKNLFSLALLNVQFAIYSSQNLKSVVFLYVLIFGANEMVSATQ